MTSHQKRALVTGGAGLIGSHVSDLLRRNDWRVRILDNLEPQTHRHGKPAWIGNDVEFVEGDVADRETITAALADIDVVFHQAAYGGYMPEIAKYVRVNSFGTAQMLEVIREQKLPIKKIVVASSQAVYSEGAATCPEHGLVFPGVRPVEQLQMGDWSVHCPICQAVTESAPTPEHAPIDLQPLHWSDRDFLHAAAQQSSTGSLRRRRADARFFVRRRYRACEFAR